MGRMGDDTMDQELSGVLVPLITPVDDEDRVDEAALRKVVRHVVAGGVHGIFVSGSAGEGPLLTLAEWVHLIQIVHDEAGGAVSLLGGVIETSTPRALERIALLREAGYHYFVLTPAFYLRMTTVQEHMRLFAACKQAAPEMEMIAYNIPVFTGCQIPVEALCDAAARGWLRYCKESSADMDYFTRVVTEGRAVGLRVFMGDERKMRDGLRAGACGIVPGCANFEPRTFVNAYEAAVRGDDAGLEIWFARMMELRDHLALSTPCWLAGIKYAASCLGLGSGKLVSPMYQITTDEAKRIHDFVVASAAWQVA